MNQVNIPQEEAQRAFDIFRYVGFSDVNPKDRNAFEAHLLSNRKIVSFHKRVLMEIGNIQFYDNPEGDRLIEPNIMMDKRSFKSMYNLYHLPYGQPINIELVMALARDGFNDGFPMGMVTDDPLRRGQILDLGNVTRDEFSKVITLETGQIRLYDVLKEVPIYHPLMFRLRN